MSDKSLSELKLALKSKENLRQKLLTITTNYTISEQFKALIDANTSIPVFFDKVSGILQMQSRTKKTLISSIDAETDNAPLLFKSTDELISCISSICDEYQKNIVHLRDEQAKKNQMIAELSSQMKSLIEQKAISTQKELFFDWFEKMRVVDELKKCQTELSTRSISILAKTASQTLVTENLKTKFQEELDALGLKKLSVIYRRQEYHVGNLLCN